MQIYPVNNFQTSRINTSFGTKIGPRLTEYLEENQSRVAFHQLININKLKENGLNNTTLELKDNDNDGKDLVLISDLVDRKNEIMNNPEFRKWKRIRSNISEFPVKDVICYNNGVYTDSVIEKFNTDYLNRNIKFEHDFAKRIIRYYKKYEELYRAIKV